jgi:hypothetical protein
MEELPADLLAALPEAGLPIAQQWWASLAEADRRRIIGLWDERLEVRFFSPQPDEAGCVDEWEQVPTVQGGRFVPSEDDGRGEWSSGYFEHLLQHPELSLAYESPNRIFHICTQHAAARACLAAGHVPQDFACPVAAASCPLLPLRGARWVRKKAEPATEHGSCRPLCFLVLDSSPEAAGPVS